MTTGSKKSSKKGGKKSSGTRKTGSKKVASLKKRAGAKKASGKKKATAAKKGSGANGGGLHQESESHPWEINIGNHPQRKDSPEYIKSRKMMISIVQATQPWYLGPKPYQDHHGGGLWLKDENGWFLVKNLAGMEWSSQFCADPAKVDALRLNAKRLYDKFPLTAKGFKGLGFDLDALLNKKIETADDIAAWTDSICNASLPLPPDRHTGVVSAKHEGGVHHYPTPITDIELFKRDDFILWVTDPEGKPAAVLPIARRGSGESRVEVAFATAGTKLHKQLLNSQKKGQRLILSGAHSMAKQAFRKQQ
jgi:uncharacterized protein DUF6424